MLRPSWLCWKVPSFQAMGSGTGEMYKGTFVFVPVAMKLMRGCPYSLQMATNTRGRRDHSVGSIWSGWVSWLVRMFTFPRRYHVVKNIANCSAPGREFLAPYHTLFMHAITVVLSPFKMRDSPMIQFLKTFKANWTTFIYMMLIWRSSSSFVHIPAAVSLADVHPN